MKKNLLYILLTISFLLHAIGFAQNDYRAELIDSENNDPVSFATVRFQGTSQGLIADYNGQFRIPKQIADSLSLLEITSIGYETKQVDIKSWKLDSINKIFMKPQVENLDLVIIKNYQDRKIQARKIQLAFEKAKSLDASVIVKRAVYSIKKNLSAKPYSYLGYYRDYQLTSKGEYYNLNEGIIEQFDAGILTNKLTDSKNQGALYLFKENQNFPVDTLKTISYDDNIKYLQDADVLPYGGNELMLLNAHNPIRIFDTKSFSYVYRIQFEFIQNHFFQKNKTYIFNDEPVIVIGISNIESPTENIYGYQIKGRTPTEHFAKGKIAISLFDYSIINFDYTIYDDNVRNALFNTKIEYKKINGKMYLNYLTFNNRFVLKSNQIFSHQTINPSSKENGFYVTFNRNLMEKTLKRNNLKLIYEGKRMKPKEIEIISPRTVLMKIKETDLDISVANDESLSNVVPIFKRIKDFENIEIYDPILNEIYQFREFFVQEVFDGKRPSQSLLPIDKLKPLSDSNTNDFINIDSYIINSPLMNRKM